MELNPKEDQNENDNEDEEEEDSEKSARLSANGQGAALLPNALSLGPDGSLNAEEGESSDHCISQGLQEHDSYHGHLPDEDIEALLKCDGDYMISTVKKDENSVLGVSVRWRGKMHFFPIREEKKQATFNSEIYAPTVLELVNLYVTRPVPVAKEGPYSCILQKPILREFWELHNDDIELLEKLGEGAFGEVRRGILRQKNKESIVVAVKLIRKEKASPESIREAMNEARMMRQNIHPNVIRFFGIQADIEPFLIVMEFIDGGSLDKYLKTNTATLTVSHRASMCHDAAQGLAYVHSKNAIHRDIAARNCLLDTRSRQLKVADFGLSSTGTMMQMDPSKPAPIRWLAPEVIGTHKFTPKADVWAFGVLCWEIFTSAELPYKEYNHAQIREKIFNETFRLQLPPTCPTQMAAVIVKCWKARPEARPTMAELVTLIQPFFDKNNEYMTTETVHRLRAQYGNKVVKKKRSMRVRKANTGGKKKMKRNKRSSKLAGGKSKRSGAKNNDDDQGPRPSKKESKRKHNSKEIKDKLATSKENRDRMSATKENRDRMSATKDSGHKAFGFNNIHSKEISKNRMQHSKEINNSGKNKPLHIGGMVVGGGGATVGGTVGVTGGLKQPNLSGSMKRKKTRSKK